MKKFVFILFTTILLTTNVAFADRIYDLINDPNYIYLLRIMNIIDVDFHNDFAVIRSNKNNKKLIFGHSLAVTCYYASYDFDVVGINGISIDGLKQILPYINKQYDTIYIWAGCNDINSNPDIYDVLKKYIELYNIAKSKNNFNTIKHIGEPKQKVSAIHTFNANKLNNFLKTQFNDNYIPVNETVDFDDYHFSAVKCYDIIKNWN